MELSSSYGVEPVLRAASVLTDAYVACTPFRIDTDNQLMLYVGYTKAASDSMQVKLEFSDDNVTFYQETFSAVVTGTSTDTLGAHTLGASGNYRIALPVKDKYVKVSVKGTGNIANTVCSVYAIVGVV